MTSAVSAVSSHQLCARLADYPDEARSGRAFLVTRNGRPAARLVPPEEVTDDGDA